MEQRVIHTYTVMFHNGAVEFIARYASSCYCMRRKSNNQLYFIPEDSYLPRYLEHSILVGFYSKALLDMDPVFVRSLSECDRVEGDILQ